MGKVKKQEDEYVFMRDIVLDGISYHFEYFTEKEEIFLYVPQIVIFCKAERLIELYPEFLGMEMRALYPEILKYISTKKQSKWTINGSKRFTPDPLSVYEIVIYISYRKDTDELFIFLPPRNITTDLLTVDVVYPELGYMHDGVLLDLIKDYIADC